MAQDAEPQLNQIVANWKRLIEISAKSEHRQGFLKTARMCSHFYCGAMGFMWTEDFRKEFLNNMPSPDFKITIAKAFEMVAVMVPNLIWDVPGRVNKPVQRIDLPVEIFGDPDDPNVLMQHDEYIKRRKAGAARDRVACALMDTYLNYSQREQPHGGLMKQSTLAIIDAIVKGRGIMHTRAYKFPGSDRTLTGSFRVKVDDFYIDPDCRNADLSDAQWIAIRHQEPWDMVERQFPHLEPGALRTRATQESATSLGANQDSSDRMYRQVGQTNDLVVWYEIYSKCGVGTRLNRVQSDLHDAFEEVVGDFARICVAENVTYPLNFPPKLAMNATDDDALQAFDWPQPIWADAKWPVSLLDFYPIPDNPYPIAPLAMGLGELTFLNIMHSCLAERVYANSRNLLFVNNTLGADSDIMSALKNAKFSDTLELNGEVGKNINELVSYLIPPPVPQDAFAMIDLENQQFERRTGLSALLYGETPGNKVFRSAADAQLKQDAAGIRTEDMGRKVEDWQTNMANVERIVAAWEVKGEYISDLFDDPLCVQLWDELITSADPEKYVRQMRTTLEAQSMKKPNKLKDVSNLQQISSWMIPMLQWYADRPDGSVEPLNGFIRAMADSMDQDAESWLLPPSQPPQPQQPPQQPGPPAPPEPDPMELQRTAQQDAHDETTREIERQQAMADLQHKQIRNQRAQFDLAMAPSQYQPDQSAA